MVLTKSPAINLHKEMHVMKFGFITYFLLAVVVIFGGAFAYLALADVPVQQQEVTVNIPLAK